MRPKNGSVATVTIPDQAKRIITGSCSKSTKSPVTWDLTSMSWVTTGRRPIGLAVSNPYFICTTKRSTFSLMVSHSFGNFLQICIFVPNSWGHPVESSLQWQMQNVNIQPKKGNVGWQISLTHVRKPVSSLGLSAFSLLAEENTSGLLSLHVLRLLLRKAF